MIVFNEATDNLMMFLSVHAAENEVTQNRSDEYPLHPVVKSKRHNGIPSQITSVIIFQGKRFEKFNILNTVNLVYTVNLSKIQIFQPDLMNRIARKT